MAAMAPSMITAEEAAALHPAPPVTESKIARLRILAANPNPKIRESVASSYHAPEDLFETLAKDPDAAEAATRAWGAVPGQARAFAALTARAAGETQKEVRYLRDSYLAWPSPFWPPRRFKVLLGTLKNRLRG